MICKKRINIFFYAKYKFDRDKIYYVSYVMLVLKILIEDRSIKVLKNKLKLKSINNNKDFLKLCQLLSIFY